MSKDEGRVRPSFLYVLSFLGMAICLFSSMGFDIEAVPLGTPFGFFGLLPFSYWVGILFLTISMGIGLRTGSETAFFVRRPCSSWRCGARSARSSGPRCRRSCRCFS